MTKAETRDVMVTGASGFIGRALCHRLTQSLPAGRRLTAISSKICDLVDQRQTFDYFKRMADQTDCSHIFHLAALYKAGDWPVHHPATQFFANMAINIHVLEAWSRFFPKARLTTVLSYCMYPSHPDPHPESELWGTEPEEYLFAYAAAKKAVLVGQRAYKREFGLTATSVVLPTVYGPGDSFAVNSHVMGALIGKFVSAKRDGASEVEVWGDGTQEREFIFVEDATEGIERAAHHSNREVLNLGTGTSHPISEIVDVIRQVTGYKGKIRYNTNRFVGVKRRLLDIGALKAELGWSPRTSLRQGIEATVAAHLRQIESVGAA